MLNHGVLPEIPVSLLIAVRSLSVALEPALIAGGFPSIAPEPLPRAGVSLRIAGEPCLLPMA
jgi:hypothetical protein